MLQSRILLLAVCTLCLSCCKEKRQHSTQGMTNDEMKELLMESSRHSAREEDKRIEAFVKKNKLNVETTGTGLRYRVDSKSDEPCDTVRGKDRVWLEYKVSLLNGEEIYNSEEGGPRSFEVDRDDVESGLHEAVKFMCLGDSGYFILPSHLAHGLTGDQRKIPSNTPIIYEIEVVQVQ